MASCAALCLYVGFVSYAKRRRQKWFRLAVSGRVALQRGIILADDARVCAQVASTRQKRRQVSLEGESVVGGRLMPGNSFPGAIAGRAGVGLPGGRVNKKARRTLIPGPKPLRTRRWRRRVKHSAWHCAAQQENVNISCFCADSCFPSPRVRTRGMRSVSLFASPCPVCRCRPSGLRCGSVCLQYFPDRFLAFQFPPGLEHFELQRITC